MKTKSPNQIRPLLAIAYFGLRAQLRNRATVFFGFVFPLMFIFAFGFFGPNGASISIGIPENAGSASIYSDISKVEGLNIQKGNIVDLQKELVAGKLTAILITENGSGDVKLLISQANQNQVQIAQSIVSGVIAEENLSLAGIKNQPVNLTVEKIAGRAFKFIDFFLPGMIGFAILATAVNNTAFGLIFLKKTLVLKRIFATPTKGLTILVGQGVARVIVVLAQTLVIVAAGVLIFDFTLIHGLFTILLIIFLSIIGLLAFMGFGLFIAGIATDENSVVPLTNIIVFPQFLVAGTFFPIENLPAVLQPFVKILPLAFFNTAIRKITTEGVSIDQVSPQLLGLLAWSVVAYIAAARTFKWE